MQQLEEWKVSDLIEYARNPRKNDHAVDKVAAAIREFGFRVPILAKSDKTVVDGHLRLKAAKKLGLETVPVILCDDMSEAQIKSFRISVNRVAEFAEWDNELLRIEFEALREMDFDIELTGFSLDEIGELEIEEIAPEYEEDADGEITEPPPEPKTKDGDVWILGKHRLMCGDSTSIDAVDKLMDGNSVDMLFTDPPYNVAFNGRSGKHDVIMNDDMPDDQFEDFINNVIQTIKTINPPIYYIWCNWDFYGVLQGKLDYKSCIVWAKNVFGMGAGYRHQHEFCLFNGKIDEHIKNESDLWHEKKDHAYVHPTQKPTALSERALGNHSKAKNILDLFGGSGSTLIGCEKTNRKAYLMELDPKYCDVIINRWQTLTGKEAILESTGDKFNDL